MSIRRDYTQVPQELYHGTPPDIGAVGAFFQPFTASETLIRSDERLLRELVSVLDRQLLAAVATRSAAEFSSVRERVLLRYIRALHALQDTASNLVSDETIHRIADSVIAELSADLEKQESRFGRKLIDQTVFTLWTLQKLRALQRQILSAGDVPKEKMAEDSALLCEYQMASWWASFHVDVLFAAIKFDRPICEQIRETICDGMRAVVNAYVIMKDALVLRCPPAEEGAPATALPWDEEDEQLLASSMRDLDAASSVDS
jgi:hypothetical protein